LGFVEEIEFSRLAEDGKLLVAKAGFQQVLQLESAVSGAFDEALLCIRIRLYFVELAIAAEGALPSALQRVGMEIGHDEMPAWFHDSR